MFKEATVFRHFGSGGRIYRRDWKHRIIFKCATCWEWSENQLDLVKDPSLKAGAPDFSSE